MDVQTLSASVGHLFGVPCVGKYATITAGLVKF